MSDLSDIRSFFASDASLVTDESTDVDPDWLEYTSHDNAVRMNRAKREQRVIGGYFPKTAKALETVLIDAFLISCRQSLFGSGVFRVFHTALADGHPQ